MLIFKKIFAVYGTSVFLTRLQIYINLYSPTSGSKEKKTYKHINTVKKQQKKKNNAKTKQRCWPIVLRCTTTDNLFRQNIFGTSRNETNFVRRRLSKQLCLLSAVDSVLLLWWSYYEILQYRSEEQEQLLPGQSFAKTRPLACNAVFV